ncbi:MAG: hypothetical protein ACRCW2_07070 [Cellulosilyticaceae bacterium]
MSAQSRSEKIVSLSGLIFVMLGSYGHGFGLLTPAWGLGLNTLGWLLLGICLLIKHDKKDLQ